MRRELLIAAGPGEWRAALVEEGEAVELYVERGDPFALNTIHLGRVVRRVPGLDAVLVEIGDRRPGFLPMRDLVPSAGAADEGARIVVQVRREAQADKAARLTTRIALRRQRLQLAVGRAASLEALPEAERDRLKEAAGETATAALGLIEDGPPDAAMLAQEAARLGHDWRALWDEARRLDPPARLDAPIGFAAALAARLPGPPERVVADDIAILRDLRAAFPASEAVVADLPLDIDAEIERALADSVGLPSGVTLHIAPVHAATLIDVDSASADGGSAQRAALNANLAAADAIARQIRLRNLAGAIIIDFIGMEGRSARERVRAALAAALARDPAGPQPLGWTRLGHFELVRPRRGRPLAETLLEPRAAPPIKTAVTLAHEALARLARAARRQPGSRWRLRAAFPVAAALRGPAAPALATLETRLGRPVEVASDDKGGADFFEILPA